MKRKRKLKMDGGFTFVETLAVLAVTAILAAQTGVVVSSLVQKARLATAKTQISMYQAALQSYYVDCGQFPTAEQGLSSLWEKPSLYPVPENWSGPYVEKNKFTDPWGTPFLYYTKKSLDLPEGTPEGLPFVLVSLGADRKKGGEENDADIISWKM